MNTGLSYTDSSQEPDFMLEINTTPLIDVMLVLLIMLIITIPLQLQTLNLELPVESSVAAFEIPNIVRIDIEADGSLRMDGQSIADRDAMDVRLEQVSARGDSSLALHIHAHAQTKYEVMAFVLASAQRHGLKKLNIVGVDRFLNQ